MKFRFPAALAFVELVVYLFSAFDHDGENWRHGGGMVCYVPCGSGALLVS